MVFGSRGGLVGRGRSRAEFVRGATLLDNQHISRILGDLNVSADRIKRREKGLYQ